MLGGGNLAPSARSRAVLTSTRLRRAKLSRTVSNPALEGGHRPTGGLAPVIDDQPISPVVPRSVRPVHRDTVQRGAVSARSHDAVSKPPPGVSTGPNPPRPNARRQSFAAIQQTLEVLPCPGPNGGEFDIQAIAARLRSSANMADRKPCNDPVAS